MHLELMVTPSWWARDVDRMANKHTYLVSFIESSRYVLVLTDQCWECIQYIYLYGNFSAKLWFSSLTIKSKYIKCLNQQKTILATLLRPVDWQIYVNCLLTCTQCLGSARGKGNWGKLDIVGRYCIARVGATLAFVYLYLCVCISSFV